MKNYTECSNEELLAFTDEQISQLIDLQCAIQGVPLPPPMPVPPISFDVSPDVTIYEVAGFNFEDEETARRVAAAINGERALNIDYDWQLDRTNYINGWSDTAAKIEPKKVFSNELYNTTLARRTQFANEQKVYDKLKKEYDSVNGERESIATEIWDAINAARDERDLKASVEAKFARYLELAGGDEAQARKFYEAAYPDEVSHLPGVET